MSVRAPFIVLATLSLSACVSQPSPPPQIPLGAAFASASLPAGGMTQVRLEQVWWRDFNDPVLSQVIEDALLGNLDITAAAARLQQAAGASRVATSPLLPSGSVSASGAAQRQSLDDPLARIASMSPDYERTNDQFGLSAAASWELDVFGRLSAARRAAGADQAAAEADVAGARLSVAAEIANAYVTARELQARARIAATRIRTTDDVLKLVALRYDEGSASRFELDQAQADASASIARLPLIEAARDETYNRIDLLSGRAPGHAAAILGEGAIPEALAFTSEDGPASLLVRRPDIVAAERRLAAADARVTEAVTAYYPRLTIQGLVGFLSSGLSGLVSEDALQTAGSAGLSGRLFDFGAARGGVEAARGRTREAAAGYKATVLRAASEAEDGFSRAARSHLHALALAESEAALARATTTARTAYDLGGLNLKDALDVQRRLLDIEDTAAAARADATRASIGLARVLGGGWSTRDFSQAGGAPCPAATSAAGVSCEG